MKRAENKKVNSLEAGNIFGEVSLLLHCSATASVVTKNYALVAWIADDIFQDICKMFPFFKINLKRKINNYQDDFK
jgi:signal-transduction protein with cAMP-binding, CBS, and nucleotidyltransferase domain